MSAIDGSIGAERLAARRPPHCRAGARGAPAAAPAPGRSRAAGESPPRRPAPPPPSAAAGRSCRPLEAHGRRRRRLLHEFRPDPGRRPRHDRAGGRLSRQLLHQPQMDVRARRADHPRPQGRGRWRSFPSPAAASKGTRHGGGAVIAVALSQRLVSMTEKETTMNWVISGHVGTQPTRPARCCPFVFAASAVQAGDSVTLMLFHDAVLMAIDGVGKTLVPFGPPNRYEEIASNPRSRSGPASPCVEARGLAATVARSQGQARRHERFPRRRQSAGCQSRELLNILTPCNK